MPKRSRSHTLEEVSIRRFQDALPENWVYRKKSPDYGIDGEVELFDPDGEASGLSFSVQIRATDQPAKAQSVRLEIDELNYYVSLNEPVMVVRYCSNPEGFFWQWASKIYSRVESSEEQKTVSYPFGDDEALASNFGALVRRYLEVQRVLKNINPTASIPVRICLDAVPSHERYEIERQFDAVIESSRSSLVRAVGEPQLFEVVIRPATEFLAVEIDSVSRLSFDLSDPTPKTFAIHSLYAMVHLLYRQRLTGQAEALAQLLIQRKERCEQPMAAWYACLALGRDLNALVDLAMVNGFHNPYNPLNMIVARFLMSAPRNHPTRSSAMLTFLDASLSETDDSDLAGKASALYNIGNFHRSQQNLIGAIQCYNQARHLRPAYSDSDYFLRELGGVLFLAQRYECSAKAYRLAWDKAPDPELGFLLADSLFQCGRVGESLPHFEKANANAGTPAIINEAMLKIFICNEIIRHTGKKTIPRRRSEANALLKNQANHSEASLIHILTQIDGLHPLAHHQLGVLRAGRDEHDAAILHFLTLAIVQPSETLAWVNASLCAISKGAMDWFSIIVHVAMNNSGAMFYDHFRSHVINNGMPTELISMLDSAALKIQQDGRFRNPEGPRTIRAFDGERYREFISE